MTGLLELADYQIVPEWVDYNDHLNDAAYALVFSRSVDALMDRVGLDAAGRAHTGLTIYTLSMLIRYLHEARLGAKIVVFVRILERDNRRLHLWLEMRSVDADILLATCEQVLLCVKQTENGPRAASFATDIAEKLTEIVTLHEGQALPKGAGEGLGLKRRAD